MLKRTILGGKLGKNTNNKRIKRRFIYFIQWFNRLKN